MNVSNNNLTQNMQERMNKGKWRDFINHLLISSDEKDLNNFIKLEKLVRNEGFSKVKAVKVMMGKEQEFGIEFSKFFQKLSTEILQTERYGIFKELSLKTEMKFDHISTSFQNAYSTLNNKLNEQQDYFKMNSSKPSNSNKIQTLEEKLSTANSENNNLKTELESTTNQLRVETAKLKSKNTELESKNTELNRKMNTETEKLKSENTELKSKNTELNRKMKAETEKLESKNTELNRKLESKNTETEKLNTELNRKLESKNTETEKLNTELNRKLESKNAETEKLNTENETLKTENKKLEAELESKTNQLKSENKKLEAEKTELNRKLSTEKKKTEKLNTENETLKTENKKLESDKIILLESKEDYKDQLALANLFADTSIELELFEKKFLIDEIGKYNEKNVCKTKRLYQYDPLNKTSFHKYIDGKPNIVLLIKLKNDMVLGGYSESPFLLKTSNNNKVVNSNGFIFSVSNTESFPIIKGKQAITYDNCFIIFGNNELRIKQEENNKFFSNFGIASAFADPKGQTVNVLIGKGKERYADISSWEVHQINPSDE